MKKIFIILFILILASGFIWLGNTQPQIQAQTIEQNVDTARFLNTQ